MEISRRYLSKATLYMALIFMLTFISPVAFAAHVSSAEQLCVMTNQSADTVSPQVEETTWYLRNYNGIVQKRLWSNTRGIWLTDWIDC